MYHAEHAYRAPRGQQETSRTIKLVHNIVLSMPAPTPPEKVLAAAKTFAREKFGLKHRYAMALHTHQQHPHVHLVVKAESEDGRRRLHIDKAMLREWREDFARMMRDQGIAANATSRVVRGQSKRAVRDAAYRAKGRQSSYALREQIQSVATELSKTGTIRDPAHSRLRQEDFCSRGRPPRLPFSRELDAFRAEVFDPANRANSLIQVFEPKMPAASSATPKIRVQCLPMQTGTQWRELYLGKLRGCGALQTLQQFRWQHQNDAIGQLDHKTRLCANRNEPWRRAAVLPTFASPASVARSYERGPHPA
jgi:hypothetical protein